MLINFKDCSQIINLIHGINPTNVYHIGAHQGQEAKDYAENGVKKVMWFEANTDLISILESHINQFNLDNKIIPYALWSENKQLEFNITNHDQSSSFFELDKHAQYYPSIVVEKKRAIQAFRMDSLISVGASFLTWNDFHFINIDTQGAELEILKGFGSHLSNDSLKGIYLEVNSEPLYKGIPLVEQLDSYLAKFNFFRCKTAWSNAGWGDALYIKCETKLNI